MPVCVPCLYGYRIMVELKEEVSRYLRFCNDERYRESLEYETLDCIHGKRFGHCVKEMAA
jgi:hypothetical protein